MLIVTDIVIIIFNLSFCSCLQLRFVICIINEDIYNSKQLHTDQPHTGRWKQTHVQLTDHRLDESNSAGAK